MLKRIGGWIVVVVAALIFVLMLGVIVGAWVGQRAIENSADTLLASLDDYLGRAGTELGDVESTLGAVQSKVDAITAATQKAAASGEKPIAESLQASVDREIQPTLERVTDLVKGVFAALTGLNATLVELNRLPNMNVPTFTTELDAVETRLQGVGDRVAGLKQTIAESDGSRIIAATTNVSTEIVAVRTQLDQALQRIDATQQRVEVFRQDLPWYLRLSAMVITFFSAFLAWGQWLLVGKSWGWARGR